MSKIVRRTRFFEALPSTILLPQYEQNDYGESILIGFLESETFMAQIQPLSGTSMRHITGATETSTHRLFTQNMLEALVTNNYVKDNNGICYLITYIEDWKTHVSAILEVQKP